MTDPTSTDGLAENVLRVHDSIVGLKVLAFELDVQHSKHGPQRRAFLRLENNTKLIYDLNTGYLVLDYPGKDKDDE